MTAAGVRLALEVPANPHVRLFHVREELTRRVVDVFGPGAPAWLEPIARREDVRETSLTRYKVRIAKRRSASWESIEPAAIAALAARFGAIGPLPPAAESVGRFGPWPGPRRVFEGVSSAESDPVGRALFAIDGVAEVVLDPLRTLVVKGRLFGGSEVFDAVRRVFARH